MNWKWLACCLMGHKDEVVSFKHYVDSSYNYKADSTKVVYRCSKCFRLDKDLNYNLGFLPREAVERK